MSSGDIQTCSQVKRVSLVGNSGQQSVTKVKTTFGQFCIVKKDGRTKDSLVDPSFRVNFGKGGQEAVSIKTTSVMQDCNVLTMIENYIKRRI